MRPWDEDSLAIKGLLIANMDIRNDQGILQIESCINDMHGIVQGEHGVPYFCIDATIRGKVMVASPKTFAEGALALIFPQLTASSGDAPESEPSYSRAV